MLKVWNERAAATSIPWMGTFIAWRQRVGIPIRRLGRRTMTGEIDLWS